LLKLKSTYSREYGQFLALLKAARKEAGLTQVALAGRLRKPQSFVSKYENAERRLDVVEFLHVAKEIGIKAEALLRDLQKKL